MMVTVREGNMESFHLQVEGKNNYREKSSGTTISMKKMMSVRKALIPKPQLSRGSRGGTTY